MSDDEQDMALTALDEQAEQRIRRVLHEGRWFFSVIDVVGLLTEHKALAVASRQGVSLCGETAWLQPDAC